MGVMVGVFVMAFEDEFDAAVERGVEHSEISTLVRILPTATLVLLTATYHGSVCMCTKLVTHLNILRYQWGFVCRAQA